MPTPSIDSRVSPAMLHILLALASRDLHGYAVMAAIRERTEGRVDIGPGTLYRTIAHLLERGWIEEVPPADDARKTYRITSLGKRVAGGEARRLSALVSWAAESDLLAGTE